MTQKGNILSVKSLYHRKCLTVENYFLEYLLGIMSFVSNPPRAVQVTPTHIPAPDVNKIHDWFIWSIINVFVGWGGGFLPLIFSIICRNKKQDNDIHGARTMSIVALVLNILSTFGGIIGWICLILVLVGVLRYTEYYT